jgi:hypothetical protein
MARKYVIVALGLLLIGCNSHPNENEQNTVGGPSIHSVKQIPMSKHAITIVVSPGGEPVAGQFEIVDIVSHGGKPNITASPGWNLLRDDGTTAIRESIYSRMVQPQDEGGGTFIFDEPVDVQGTIMVLDNVAAEAPIDTSSGGVGGPGTPARSIDTSSDGDLIIAFFATDFGGPGLAPQLPAGMAVIANQEAKPLEYWILGTYQNFKGYTAPIVTSSAQLYDQVAAQLAIRRKGATAPGSPG